MRKLELFKLAPNVVAYPSVAFANLAGDYRYLESGYYASLDAELAGVWVVPTTAEALDAYVVPIAMEKAALAGLEVPDWEIVTDRFPEPPFMAYPINPFSDKGELILDSAMLEDKRKGLTYTGKYPVISQLLPDDVRIDAVRCVLGRCLTPEFEDVAASVFAAFRLPLMRVRVFVASRRYLLSAIEPLPFDELTLREKELLEGLGTWQS